MLLRLLGLSNLVLVIFSLMLKHSCSDDEMGETESNSSVSLRIVPTPLIRDLNRSVAEMLIHRANSWFVSNTSIDDLIHDNSTQQLFLRYRQRKRQARIMTIQREILLKLGLAHQPNVTSRMSDEQRQFLMQSFDRRRTESSDNFTVISCETENGDPC